jgi:hypothetical protein
VPMEEVAFAAQRHRARGAVLSVAAGYRGDLPAEIRSLAGRVPASFQLAVGGAGSRQVSSEQVLNNLIDLSEWANRLTGVPSER